MNNMDSTMILVDADEYEELQDAQLMLQCLENAGVDNWDGYSEALREYNSFQENQEEF
jgi:hypothetical protein